MRRRPRVNRERLTVAHVRQIADQLEVIHDLAAGAGIPFDAKTQDTTEATLEVFLRQLMALMALQTRVLDPRHVLILLEPLRELKCVLGVAFGAQTQRLDTEEELLGGEGVEGAA